MFDWMSSGQGPGPGPLDLVTPLAEGQKLGLQERYRQDQIKEAADRISVAKQQLGIEASHDTAMEGLESQRISSERAIQQANLDLQKTEWDSGAAIRANQAKMSALGLQGAQRESDMQLADAQAVHNWNDDQFAPAKLSGDPAKIAGALANRPLTTTPQWSQIIDGQVKSLAGTGVGNAYEAYSALTQVPGADVKAHYNPDGTFNTGMAQGTIQNYANTVELAKSKASAAYLDSQDRNKMLNDWHANQVQTAGENNMRTTLTKRLDVLTQQKLSGVWSDDSEKEYNNIQSQLLGLGPDTGELNSTNTKMNLQGNDPNSILFQGMGGNNSSVVPAPAPATSQSTFSAPTIPTASIPDTSTRAYAVGQKNKNIQVSALKSQADAAAADAMQAEKEAQTETNPRNRAQLLSMAAAKHVKAAEAADAYQKTQNP